MPPSCIHGSNDFIHRADKANINRISRHAHRRMGDHGATVQTLLITVMPPNKGEKKVGDKRPPTGADPQPVKGIIGHNIAY